MFSGSVSPSRWIALDSVAVMSRFERVAELVGLRRAAGFDAGGQIARVVPSKARFAQRSQQIAQRLEAQEVETLVGDFELGLLRLAGLSADARLPRGIVRLIDGNVIFLLHALDELFDQFVELAICASARSVRANSRRTFRHSSAPARWRA